MKAVADSGAGQHSVGRLCCVDTSSPSGYAEFLVSREHIYIQWYWLTKRPTRRSQLAGGK